MKKKNKHTTLPKGRKAKIKETEIKPVFNFKKHGISVQDIRDSAAKHLEAVSKSEGLRTEDSFGAKQPNESQGMFLVQTLNRCVEESKNTPMPKMLFGEFWGEGELCILFAESGLGKSILAVQIGNSISGDKKESLFKMEAEAQKVLYYDFEQNAKQVEKRYSNEYQNHYTFDERLFRIAIDPDAEIPDDLTFEDYLNLSIERSIVETGAKILIFDNLTYLKSETEKAQHALPLMKHLKTLKNKYELSILALAHTPKRDLSKPVTRNDLQGSKMLYNFCDSAFAIGESATDKGIRYLKQIKPRNTELIYDAENVCVCQVIKHDNFLQYEFLGFGTEMEHLKQGSEKDKQSAVAKVKELNRQGKTQRQISTELHISLASVNRYLKI